MLSVNTRWSAVLRRRFINIICNLYNIVNRFWTITLVRYFCGHTASASVEQCRLCVSGIIYTFLLCPADDDNVRLVATSHYMSLRLIFCFNLIRVVALGSDWWTEHSICITNSHQLTNNSWLFSLSSVFASVHVALCVCTSGFVIVCASFFVAV